MSYSFTVRAATKSEAKALVAVELDKVVNHQPGHAADRAQAQAVAEAFIDLLPDDDTRDVAVNMHGSVMGQWAGLDLTRLTAASVGVNASLADRLPA